MSGFRELPLRPVRDLYTEVWTRSRGLEGGPPGACVSFCSTVGQKGVRAARIGLMDKTEALIAVRDRQTDLVTSPRPHATKRSWRRFRLALPFVRSQRGRGTSPTSKSAALLGCCRSGSSFGEDEYDITRHQSRRAWIYKLLGFNNGKFPGDVERINATFDWLAPAGDPRSWHSSGQRRMAGRANPSSTVTSTTSRWGYALRIVLTFSYLDRPSDVARLFDALAARYKV